VVNYLARLGWSHGDDEVFSREELVAWFDLVGLTPSPGRFDPDKLKWLNHEHLKRLPGDELGRRLVPFLEQAGLDWRDGPPPEAVAALLRDRSATLVEMAGTAHYFYGTPTTDVPDKFAAAMTEAIRPALRQLYATFESIDWTRAGIGAAIKATAASHGLKPPQIMMAVRALVTGEPQTPAIDAVLELLGRETTRRRMKAGLSL
jgi:glutamyl-tRNA synthetase